MKLWLAPLGVSLALVAQTPEATLRVPQESKTITVTVDRGTQNRTITLRGDVVMKPQADLPLALKDDQGELVISDQTGELRREFTLRGKTATYQENGKAAPVTQAKAWLLEVGSELSNMKPGSDKATNVLIKLPVSSKESKAPQTFMMIERKTTEGLKEGAPIEIKADPEKMHSTFVIKKMESGEGQSHVEMLEAPRVLRGMLTQDTGSLEQEIKLLREELRQIREELKKLNK